MNAERKNFYTVSEVYNLVFQGALSKTTIHKMIRTGKIPSVEFMSKKLVPAYWVEECLAKTQGQTIL